MRYLLTIGLCLSAGCTGLPPAEDPPPMRTLAKDPEHVLALVQLARYYHSSLRILERARNLYERALEELAPILFPDGAPARGQDQVLRQNRR